ncbi:glycosyltransferase involved in cell wall biosynthesis [Chryseobacterium ginsenosidimutans]|uniref:glycosyltransferase n=1 Tax=Chryseobacterium ginsenosidimutans TaxID=687846 RepID=UPI00278A70FE|nr:glycosyltransferase [Chryseobacterium ginsenosidimutans]MDQ0594975.1 glycosyltransferase involved in cell wall biosynthesis [Chryseobacterium ginsenosidimutans]
MKNKLNRRKRLLRQLPLKLVQKKVPQLLMISTFPPRECGIATYTQDLIQAINNKFAESFDIKICALENGKHDYDDNVSYILETKNPASYYGLIRDINASDRIELIVLQHEFGLFRGNEKELLILLQSVEKTSVVVFHTVLPKPDRETQQYIRSIAEITSTLIVMTQAAKKILEDDYLIAKEKITVIPHGTHLVENFDKKSLKEKHGYRSRKVLSTFGLLSSGKGIETTLKALPYIIAQCPETLFLIIGKTHPCVVQQEGEKYRQSLELLIEELDLSGNVNFVNDYLPLDLLLEYLQLTDIYLFTSKDPNQAVSGTFSYAISCGCPIISTPIPHALEVLEKGAGTIIGFNDSLQLTKQVVNLLDDELLRNRIALNGLHQMAPTAWENSAIAHVQLFKSLSDSSSNIQYKMPEINLNHLKKMTTDFGILQFSIINHPDKDSGYTLDDNARALIAICQHYKIFNIRNDLEYINIYFYFILFSFQEDCFLNYIDIQKQFTTQNGSCNLEDSFGRAIWALGYLISMQDIIPPELIVKAKKLFNKAILHAEYVHSTRAMAFIIKGVYFANTKNGTPLNIQLIEQLADRLVQMYKHETDDQWQWYESYLTYANSVLPEAMLFAWLTIRKPIYQSIALDSFDFLLSKIFLQDAIKVISNKCWMHNGQEINPAHTGGEQPIDVAYTIIALNEFYNNFRIEDYKCKMFTAFDWFLGNNHLSQIVYNPCTGGCYDGVEDSYINLNQGAESTISYLMARLTIEKHIVSAEKSGQNTQDKKIHFLKPI